MMQQGSRIEYSAAHLKRTIEATFFHINTMPNLALFRRKSFYSIFGNIEAGISLIELGNEKRMCITITG